MLEGYKVKERRHLEWKHFSRNLRWLHEKDGIQARNWRDYSLWKCEGRDGIELHMWTTYVFVWIHSHLLGGQPAIKCTQQVGLWICSWTAVRSFEQDWNTSAALLLTKTWGLSSLKPSYIRTSGERRFSVSPFSIAPHTGYMQLLQVAESQEKTAQKVKYTQCFIQERPGFQSSLLSVEFKETPLSLMLCCVFSAKSRLESWQETGSWALCIIPKKHWEGRTWCSLSGQS